MVLECWLKSSFDLASVEPRLVRDIFRCRRDQQRTWKDSTSGVLNGDGLGLGGLGGGDDMAHTIACTCHALASQRCVD